MCVCVCVCVYVCVCNIMLDVLDKYMTQIQRQRKFATDKPLHRSSHRSYDMGISC